MRDSENGLNRANEIQEAKKKRGYGPKMYVTRFVVPVAGNESFGSTFTNTHANTNESLERCASVDEEDLYLIPPSPSRTTGR